MPSTDTDRYVLLVNPNTNTSTMMTGLAAQYLQPHAIHVRGTTVAAGPRMLIDPVALAESAEHVVAAARAADNGEDPVAAIIVAAIGDPDRSVLASQVQVPVIEIGQASILVAPETGQPFGMATSTPQLAPSLEALVTEHGAAGSFRGVRLTASDPLTLAADPERQFAELADAVRACVQLDGCQSVIIEGGPLSETARCLTDLGIAKIIEPIPSACEIVCRTLARHPPSPGVGLASNDAGSSAKGSPSGEIARGIPNDQRDWAGPLARGGGGRSSSRLAAR